MNLVLYNQLHHGISCVDNGIYIFIQACEAWKKEAEEARMKANQIDEEKKMAIKQRDEV